MKKYLLVFLSFLWVSHASAQVFNPAASSQFTAFDTNGPIGECLFPTDDKYQEVVTCDTTKEAIADAIQALSNRIELTTNKRVSINHFEKTNAQITFDVQLYVGKTTVELPWVGVVEKQYSEVKYKALIELKDKKFRITFFNFYTDRVTIRGEAKSNGPSNLIHWQRVNSLKAERDEIIDSRKKLSGKKQSEVDGYNNRIAQEEAIYKEEWQSVCNMMEQIKGCLKEEDF